MAGLLDFLNSDDARLGIGLLAASGPQTDPTKTGFGYALQSAMNTADAQKTAALQRQLLGAQATEAQQKAAVDTMNLQRLKSWNAMVAGGTTPDDGAPMPAPTPGAPQGGGLLGANMPAPGATPGGMGVGTTTAGAAPMDSTAPAAPPQARASTGGFRFALPGIPEANSRALAMNMGPDAYMKLYADKSGLMSDMAKQLHDAGVAEGSPMWQQTMNQAIQKATNIAPVNARAGSTLLDPITHQPIFNAPHVPEGFAPIFDASGNTTGYRKIAGGTAAMAAGEEAKKLGSAAGTSTTGFDAITGLPTYRTGLQDIQAARGMAPTGNVTDMDPTTQTGPGAAPPGATLGMRNNNPGNLRPPGASAGFQQFATPEEGLAALDKNLQNYGTKGVNTIAGVISKWAPPSENNTPAYVKSVADRLGIAPDAKIDLSNPYVRHALSAQIMLHENGSKILTAPGPAAQQAPQGPSPAPGQTIPQLPAGFEKGQTLSQDELSTKWSKLAADNGQTNNVISRLQSIKMLAPQAITGTEQARLDYMNGLLAMVNQKAADTKTASDLLDKNAAQITSALRMGSSGGGSDQLQTLISAANPNRHMSAAAINEAADSLIAGQRMTQAKAQLLSKSSFARNPQDYGAKELAFDQAADPRVFQINSMNDIAAKAYLDKMPIDQARELMGKVQTLKKMGAL